MFRAWLLHVFYMCASGWDISNLGTEPKISCVQEQHLEQTCTSFPLWGRTGIDSATRKPLAQEKSPLLVGPHDCKGGCTEGRTEFECEQEEFAGGTVGVRQIRLCWMLLQLLVDTDLCILLVLKLFLIVYYQGTKDTLTWINFSCSETFLKSFGIPNLPTLSQLPQLLESRSSYEKILTFNL